MKNQIITKNKLPLYVILLLFLGLQFLQTAPVIANMPDARQDQDYEMFFDAVLQEQMSTNPIAGVTVSVVQDGELAFAKGYGYADMEADIPVSVDDSLFFIGSDGKLFTWTAVMQLVEEGKLDLFADVNDYLDFEVPATFTDPVTLHHLLTHSAGFEDELNSLFRQHSSELRPLREHLMRYMPERVYAPGEVMAYSNYGTALAGYVIERVSGQDFETYLEENILQPLEMNHSFVGNDVPAELSADVSKGYLYQNGVYNPSDFEWTAAVPCAPLRTTAADMSRFMLAHLNGGCVGADCILDADTVAQMHSPQFTNHPQMSGMAYGLMDSEFNGQRVLWHMGESPRFITLLALIPEQNLGIFVSYNTPPADGRAILFQFLDTFYPVNRMEPERNILPGWEDRANLFNGTYAPARSNHTTAQKLIGVIQSVPVTIDVGKLTFLGMEFIETQPGVFHQIDGDRVVAFEQDEQGRRWLFMGILAYFQVAWYQTPGFIICLLAISVLLFLSAWLVWPLRKKSENKPKAAVLWLAALLGLFDLGLLVWFGLQLLQYSITYSFPQDVVLLITNLYWLAVPWTLVLAGICVRAWVLKHWTVSWRIHYSAVTLGAVGLLWLIWNQNLLSSLF